MKIIGITYNHHGSSAALVIDGKVVACLAEERLNRVKNSSSFPINSLDKLLSSYSLKKENIDFFCINSNPKIFRKEKLLFFLKNIFKFLYFHESSLFKIKSILKFFNYKHNDNGFFSKIPNNKIISLDHHLCHLNSAFLISPFEDCVNLSLDGSGDFKSGSYGLSKNNKTIIDNSFYYPNSLGLFYLSMTQFIGFKNAGDEYKVMGLSAYGSRNDALKKKIEQLISYENLNILTNTRYFAYPFRNILKIKNNEILFDNLFSIDMEDFLNIKANEKFVYTQTAADLALATQEVYEDIFLKILDDLYLKYNNKNLCFSGGCALNSKANGKILKNTKFQNIFIPSEPGDSGGAVGAAILTYYEKSGNAKFYQPNPYLSPPINHDDILVDLQGYIKANRIIAYTFKTDKELYNKVANLLANNNVIAWFQDKMEFGPRALGNRSILMNPQNKDAKNILNLKIKLRESYRPFAPAIMEEHLHDWFEDAHPSPYMNFVFTIKKEKRKFIPAVCHVDNTGRVQTVSESDNEKFYKLIRSFYSITGIPILINTSFNENEPITYTAKDAIETFLKTKIDHLILQNHLITKIE